MLKTIRERIEKGKGCLPPIFLFSLSIFFWTLFDASLTYITPLLMEKNGISMSMIGVIIGTSAISGAVFDFIFCKYFKNSDFRRMILLMFSMCLFYPLILFESKTIWFFLLAMSFWGMYYDLYSFGVFNFIGRYSKKEDHSFDFGIVQIFRALGNVLAPLIAGYIIATQIDWRLFASSWFFLIVAIMLFVSLLILLRKAKPINLEEGCNLKRHRNFLTELYLWKKLFKIMSPVLLVTFYIYVVESFFWTLAPLYIENENIGKFGGLFLTAYILPALFVGWFVNRLTANFGKKKTAIIGLMSSSVILSLFVFSPSPLISIITVFSASCCISVSLPAINAAYADYISEAPLFDSEIEGVEDFLFNISYIIGPISAGIIADQVNIPTAFTLLGLFGLVLAVILLFITPKNIDIVISIDKLT